MKCIQNYLRDGKNEVVFKIKGDHQTKISADLFHWNSDTKIVVSDVDGTVTQSDIKGHILPRMGLSDWSQPNIAELYTNIVK